MLNTIAMSEKRSLLNKLKRLKGFGLIRDGLIEQKNMLLAFAKPRSMAMMRTRKRITFLVTLNRKQFS